MVYVLKADSAIVGMNVYILGSKRELARRKAQIKKESGPEDRMQFFIKTHPTPTTKSGWIRLMNEYAFNECGAGV
tara:strand:- start:55 stop:279 length:225 start_codon:yes stop_codon:yes gene_type:complete